MPIRPDIEAAGISHVGSVRKNNEDAFKYLAEGGDFWAVVADGCGGENAGEIASNMALEVFTDHISRDRKTGRDPAYVLRDAVIEANRRIVAEQSEGREGMGTTFSALFFRGREVYYVHVGDSRIYRKRAGEFELLTEDHTWVNAQVKAGRLAPEEAETHPNSAWLLRAVGMDDFKAPDVDFFSAAEGDRFLLCTDGIMKCVSDNELSGLMDGEPEQAVQSLIDLCLERGSPDNVTAVILTIRDFGPYDGDTLLGY